MKLDYEYYNDDYIVLENGDVFKKLKRINNKRGYHDVSIYGNKIKLHRVVMEAFKGKSKLTVDHIDGDKKNNNLTNLRYMTQGDNTRAMFKRIGTEHLKENAKGKRKGHELTIKGVNYESFSQASRELNIPLTTLNRKYKAGRCGNED